VPRELLRKTSAKYVLNQAATNAVDPRLSYLGKLYIATIGMSNTSAIGELRVKYRVKLRQPQNAPIGGNNVMAHFYSKFCANNSFFNGTIVYDPNTPQYIVSGINFGANNTIIVNNNILGTYLFVFITSNSSTAYGMSGGLQATWNGGVQAYNTMIYNSLVATTATADSTGTVTAGNYVISVFTAQITGSGSITLTNPTFTTSGTGCFDLWISALPGGMTSLPPIEIKKTVDDRIAQLENEMERMRFSNGATTPFYIEGDDEKINLNPTQVRQVNQMASAIRGNPRLGQ